jgi:hypothetical protein
LASEIGRPKKFIISFLISHWEAGLSSRPEREQADAYGFGEEDEGAGGTLRKALSPFEKYKRLPDTLSNLSYLEFLEYYNFARLDQITKRRGNRARIPMYYPEYKLSGNVEDFVRVKLMLHHPFRQVDELKPHPTTVNSSIYRDFQIFGY